MKALSLIKCFRNVTLTLDCVIKIPLSAMKAQLITKFCLVKLDLPKKTSKNLPKIIWKPIRLVH